MKKLVFCLVTLAFALPVTGFAEETLSTSELTKIESSSVESTQDLEQDFKATLNSSFSSTTNSDSTETSSSVLTGYGDSMLSTVIVTQGEKLTAEMILDDVSSHGSATYNDLKLLEEAPTETLGQNHVKISFTVSPSEGDKKEKQKITLDLGYIVINATPNYNIQFISYDTKKNEVKGRVQSINGDSTDSIPIYGRVDIAAATIKELYPLVDPNTSTTTDAEGYFTLPYQNNFSFAAFFHLTGEYSPVYTLTDKAFAAAATTDSSTPVKSTESSSVKKEEKKKGLFPNTGEKKTVYFSIAGIAIILLIVLFLFIKSKKNEK